jgi:signal transduction histidine kinase
VPSPDADRRLFLYCATIGTEFNQKNKKQLSGQIFKPILYLSFVRQAKQGVTDRSMLRVLTRPMINWAAPVARILMCMIIMDGLYLSDRPLLHWFLLLWVCWAAVTSAATAIGHHHSISELRILAAIDSLMATLCIFLLANPEPPVIAFAFCVSVTVLGCRLGLALLAFLVALPFTAWLGHEVLEIGRFHPAHIISVKEGEMNGLITAIGLWAVAATAAVIHRRARIDSFVYKFNSIEMLHPERSFEFDLHGVVENLAKIFAPERAFCVITQPAINTGYRQFAHNCDLTMSAADLKSLLELTVALPERALIIDTEIQLCWPLDASRPRPLDETEQAFARYLMREKFVIAIVQHLQIGKSQGLMVVAAMKPIDACLRVDAIKIEKNVTRLAEFLTRMAEAERQFIADAHDVARRDLHDGVLQSMAALRMKLLTIAKREDLKKHPALLDLRKAADILTLEQVRLRGLLETSESENDTINLVARLDICLRTISLQWEIDAKIESEEPAVPVDRESALNIEHLVREAVANAVRHAKISALTVRLSLKHDVLLIAINERGGQLEHSGKGEGSMPLQSASLQHRLRLVNGAAYAEGLAKGGLLAISIPMQQVNDA